MEPFDWNAGEWNARAPHLKLDKPLAEKFAKTFGFNPETTVRMSPRVNELLASSLEAGKVDLDLLERAPPTLVKALRAKGLLDE